MTEPTICITNPISHILVQVGRHFKYKILEWVKTKKYLVLFFKLNSFNCDAYNTSIVNGNLSSYS